MLNVNDLKEEMVRNGFTHGRLAKEKATHAVREQEQPNLNRVSRQLANSEKCECKIVEWNPDEEMTKEFALSALKEIKLFYRRLYYFPEKKPFINDEDFDRATQVLDGFKDLIEKNVKV